MPTVYEETARSLVQLEWSECVGKGGRSSQGESRRPDHTGPGGLLSGPWFLFWV